MHDGPFYHLIFCLPLRVLYAPVPKAGCTSIKSYLRRQMRLPDLGRTELIHGRQANGFTYAQQIEREALVRHLSGGPSGLFKFTVCRNPYARLVSAYEDLVALAEGQAEPRGGAAVAALTDTYCRVHDKRPSEVPSLTFPMFVRAIAHHDPAALDRHWQLQTVLTCSHLIRYDMVIRLEELGDKAELLAENAGLSDPVAFHLNARQGDAPDLRAYFDDETKEIAKRVYQRDFRRFRYDPDVVPVA